MDNSNEFEDDPPTVVERPRTPVLPAVNHRIDVGMWKFVPHSLQRTVLRFNQLFVWLASL